MSTPKKSPVKNKPVSIPQKHPSLTKHTKGYTHMSRHKNPSRQTTPPSKLSLPSLSQSDRQTLVTLLNSYLCSLEKASHETSEKTASLHNLISGYIKRDVDTFQLGHDLANLLSFLEKLSNLLAATYSSLGISLGNLSSPEQ